VKRVLVTLGFGSLLCLAAAAGTAAAAAVGAAAPDSTAAPDSSLVFRLEVGNRMYPDWKEEQQVRLAEPFHLGDTEFRAEVDLFLPDFRLGDTGPFSASPAWNNPAVRVIVHGDSTEVDSTWAFRNFPPHYSPRLFFTFKLLEIVTPRSAPEVGRRP